jgi:hydroxyacylglutathione hydrolase
VDETVGEGDPVRVGSLAARVIETPGHTAGHISYWFEAERIAFVGDTLFSIGCGRVIEGTMAMMWESLTKLRVLPDDARFYCGHEYTKSNAAFALSVDPDNAALKRRAAEVDTLRAQGKPTLPATIGAEKAANPFLRADDPALAARLGLAGGAPAEVFAKLRGAKDNFRG